MIDYHDLLKGGIVAALGLVGSNTVEVAELNTKAEGTSTVIAEMKSDLSEVKDSLEDSKTNIAIMMGQLDILIKRGD